MALADPPPVGRRHWRMAFIDAGRGLRELLRTERNARIHAVATASVVLLGTWLEVTPIEWGLLAAALSLVWVAEAMNTALERLADLVSPQHDARVARIKDLAAGGVLAGAIGAVLIGGVVFGPRLLALLRS